MKIVSVVNHKGGVGKSTISLNLALCYAESLKVALVDSDVQGSITNLDSMVDLSLQVIPIDQVNDLDTATYDVLIIDTPPYYTNHLDSIISMSDFVLVPVKPGYFDVLAVKPTVKLITSIQLRNSNIKAGIVLNMVKPRTTLNQEIKNLLNEQSLPTLTTTLSERVSYSRSPLSTEGVFSLDDDKAKIEMTALADEILTLIGL